MNRLRVSFSLLLLSIFIPLCNSVCFADEKPNILFILSDDQRWDTLGCYGNTTIKTPNLDKFAAEGARLDAFYVAQSLCCPSRATFLSGLYPHQTGITSNQHGWDLTAETKTVADYLNAAGYKTGFVGKAHLGGDPFHWGFQSCPVFLKGASTPHSKPRLSGGNFENVHKYVNTIFADSAIDFIANHKTEPWFLWLATTAPHAPYIDDPKYNYDPAKLKEPPGWPPGFTLNKEEWAHYAATITLMDDEIGRVLAKLNQMGLDGKTFVLFASDNGFMFGSHTVDEKDWWYEEAVRVPALARWPGHIKAGSKLRDFFSSVDLLPTILDIAGVAQPPDLEGKSMLPALKGGSALRTAVFAESSTWQMVRKDDWKYVIDRHGRGLLFNLKEDPYEAKNLLAGKQESKIGNELRSLIEQWQKKTPVVPGTFHTERKEEKKAKKEKKAKNDNEEEE